MDVRTDGDIADSFWWRRTTLTRRTPLYDACVSVGLLVAATIVGALLDHPGLAPSIMIVYVFAVQLCAFFTWSRLYCLLSSAAAVALYNFLFVDPRYSLSLIDRVYPGMFFIMFVVSLVSSSIALALRRALAQAAASDRRTHMVLETNRMLQRCADQQPPQQRGQPHRHASRNAQAQHRSVRQQASRRQRRLGGKQRHIDRVVRQPLDTSEHQRADRSQHRLPESVTPSRCDREP